MTTAISEPVKRTGAFPLRIFDGKNGPYLSCPFEMTYDNTVIEHPCGDLRVIHLEANSIPDEFKRHFLYSRAGQRHILTASGYLFDGPVEVYHLERDISPSMDILSHVEMVHVRGDRRNKTGGLDRAIEMHMRRLEGLRADNLSIEDGQKFLDLLINYMLRY